MRSLFLAVAALVLLSINAGWAADLRPAQTRCPISGKPVDGRTYVDVDGFRILVAGEKEAEAVRQNPVNAFAALAKNREAAVPVVWICPSMGNPVGLDYPFVEQEGKRIYYCCGPCQSKIKKNFKGAAATMKKFADDQAAGKR